MEEGALWPKFILILILIIINGFFASAEMAMVSANKNKIKEKAEKGDKRAETLLSITEDQTRFLSTIQVAITLAGFFSSGSAALSVSQVLGKSLYNFGIPYAKTISFVLVTFLLSYITLVLGELVPKRIALKDPEKVAIRSSYIIRYVSKLFFPFVKLLSVSTIFVLKLLGKYSEDVEEKISEEELKSYIRVSQQAGVINSTGEKMIVNIMDFDDKLAYEIMTPRTSIYMIDIDEFSTEMISEILKSGYSRMPVYKDNTDNIIGVLYIKDLFVEYDKNNYEPIELENIIKIPYFVPETKKIDILLKDLQSSKNYIALLIDEYGGFSGMVTVEDIVEEIVGEIEDEYDYDYPAIKKIKDNNYIVDGAMTIDDVNNQLNINLNSDKHETISGLIIEKLGYIPKTNISKNLKLNIEGCILSEMKVKDKKILSTNLELTEEAKKDKRYWLSNKIIDIFIFLSWRVKD